MENKDNKISIEIPVTLFSISLLVMFFVLFIYHVIQQRKLKNIENIRNIYYLNLQRQLDSLVHRNDTDLSLTDSDPEIGLLGNDENIHQQNSMLTAEQVEEQQKHIATEPFELSAFNSHSIALPQPEVQINENLDRLRPRTPKVKPHNYASIKKNSS